MHEFEVRISTWNEYVYTLYADDVEHAKEKAFEMRQADIERFGNDDVVTVEVIDYDAPIGYTFSETGDGCCGNRCKCAPY